MDKALLFSEQISSFLVLSSMRIFVLIIAFQMATLQAGYSQQPIAPKTAEGQDQIKVLTEEVRISINAYDQYGRFDPTLELSDLLVREDGVVQQLKSLYRTPANVLLVLDTGVKQNSAKNVRLTREVAISIVSKLQKDDQISVMQINDRVELVHNWTASKPEIVKSLNNRLFARNGLALSKGIMAAVNHFQQVPLGNRHLIMVTDGVESASDKDEHAYAMKRLIAANITVHVMSYTSLGQNTRKPSVTRPREKSSVPEEVILSMPRQHGAGDPRPDMVDVLRAKGGTVVDLERLWKKGYKEYDEAMERSEQEMTKLVEETGGGMWLPLSAEEMLNQTSEVAQDVDSQYVITYRPKRPLASSAGGEYRKIDIISRRNGLNVRSRRGYIMPDAQ